VTLTEFIDNHLTNVVTGGSVLIARITEPHYQPRHNVRRFLLVLIQLQALLELLHLLLELLLQSLQLMLRDALRGEQLSLLDRE
jgi:hypothetical protein